MFGRKRRQRIQEGALSAERTPRFPPARTRLVPLGPQPVPREEFVRRLEREGGHLVLPPPPRDPGKSSA